MQQDFNAALEKALKTLRASDRFESEVRSCLSDHSPETIDDVVAHLRGKGILNDERTAASVISRRSGSKAYGRDRLQAELERKGAAANVIEAALPDHQTELERLRGLLASKFTPADRRDRAGRFLFGRGFSAEDIEAELDNFFGGQE
jgi:regulatory protein